MKLFSGQHAVGSFYASLSLQNETCSAKFCISGWQNATELASHHICLVFGELEWIRCISTGLTGTPHLTSPITPTWECMLCPSLSSPAASINSSNSRHAFPGRFWYLSGTTYLIRLAFPNPSCPQASATFHTFSRLCSTATIGQEFPR